MQRLGRAFALLQVTGEILNDIEGFEHIILKLLNKPMTVWLETIKR